MPSQVTTAEIEAKITAVLARLQNASIAAEERSSLRRILDTLIEAREDAILGDFELAAARVAAATKALEELRPGSPFSNAPNNSNQPIADGQQSSADMSVPAQPSLAPAWQAEYEKLIDGAGLRYFKPYELLVKGAAHTNPASRAYGLNLDPPKELWANIVPTIRVLDELRHRLKAPIVLSSTYRSYPYNKAIGGAAESQHLRFCAIDFVVRGISVGPQDWAAALRDMRQSGMFKGGIGVYPGFVHVDTRGVNSDWGA